MDGSPLDGLPFHSLEVHMILISAIGLAVILFLFSSPRFLWALIGMGLLVYILLS